MSSLLDSVMWKWRSWDDIKSASLFTLSNYLNIILLVVFVGLAILQARSKVQEAKKAGLDKRVLRAQGFPQVHPLEDFDWKTTEPEKYRPFKAKYHLTMADDTAIENLDPEELILMDKNYLDRIQYRKKIIQENHDIAIGVNDENRIGPAVRELYTYLLGTYLPTRYESMFRVHQTDYETGKVFMTQNSVTNEIHSTKPSEHSKTASLLEVLGRNIDDDFLFLLPEAEGDDPKYVLEAYVTCCPSGFNTAQKLGKKLADIHEPVPAYKEKLQGSMDRFFAKVETGRYVKRFNWTITTHGELFTPGNTSNHAREGDVVEELKEIDVENTFVRVERQTLHRLPKSQALVFAFKTYLYPIKQIKEEGRGEELAQAIDGMKEGNVPAIHFYKRGIVWGEAVKRYLHS